MFWALAKNEFRVCARLSRTKFILAIAFVICVWYFVIVSLFHMQDSGVVPMYGILSPRYLLSILGDSYLALFCLGVLLLSYDVHARDENNHILEVLQSKPVGSLQVFVGRLFGVFVVMGLPAVLFLVVAVLYGFLSEAFALPFGEPIELWSVTSFLVLDVVPSFFFFGCLVFFLAWFIKPRFVALFVGAFCLYGLLWVNSRLPLEVFKPLQTVTGNVIFPSELIPNLLDTQIVLNRIALILMGLGFLYWLSVLYARNTDSNAAQRAKGFYAFGAGSLLIVGMLGSNYLEQQQAAGWKRFHDRHFEPTSFPDIHHLGGTVDVHPGRNVALDLNLEVSVSDDYLGDFVLFSLNPNFRIREITVAGETVEGRKFNSGLLKVPRHYFEGGVVEMQLQATGRPKSKFAYLDSLDKVSNIYGPEARQLRFLGTENYIFDSRFVALMPGIKWYPTSGTATNEDLWSKRQKDFFTVDLLVSVPSKWLVAGPAQRELVENKGRLVFRFQTHKPVPHIALIASRFERVSHQIDEVEYELLYDRSHRSNFEAFTVSDTAPLLPSVRGHLEEVRLGRFDYPYSVYSLIEVPASLRTFGGDSRLSSVLGMPGILMMPETTLPTMHLDSLRSEDDDYFNVADTRTDPEWVTTAQLRLTEYFGIDRYAGNHLVHFYQSILSDQFSATGPGATMLNLILAQVVQLTFSEREISFDFDIALDREVLDLTQIDPIQILNVLRTVGLSDQRVIEISRSDQILDLRSARDRKLTSYSVLEAVETLSLIDFDSSNVTTQERRALRLRALAVSKVLIDVWGTDVTNSIVEELLQRYRGQNFTYDDFIAVAQSQGVDFRSRLDDMIHSSSLPGFIASDPVQRRVSTEEGEPTIFETSFTLQNGEPVSGYCLVIPVNSPGMRQQVQFFEKTPIFVDENHSLEVVVQSKRPIFDIVFKPYLSLNRTEFHLRLPLIEDLTEEEREARGKAEVVAILELESDQSVRDPYIVIDDLDSGFSVFDKSSQFKFQPRIYLTRHFLGISDNEMIRGLPVFRFEDNVVPNDTWERKTEPTAYGKYWKTFAVNQGGSGETFAKFVTTLPAQGSWRLEYFLPERFFSRVRQYAGGTSIETSYPLGGVARFDVHVDEVVRTESMDTEDAESGWHVIGSYNVENPEVEVWISNPNKYRVVYADAIRWSPVELNE